MAADEILLGAEERMEKAVDVFRNSLTGIRTGRANPGLVDSLRAEVYGSPTPIKSLANVGAPEPNQIVIRPFDPDDVPPELLAHPGDFSDPALGHVPLPRVYEPLRTPWVPLPPPQTRPAPEADEPGARVVHANKQASPADASGGPIWSDGTRSLC